MKDTNELKKMICREYGISLDEFDSQFKYGNIPQARQLFCLALKDSGMSVTEISNTTGFSIPRVSMTINAGETLCDKIPFFKLRREGIAKIFS